MSRAIVLLSGGLDSATVLGLMRARGFECYAMAFDYGQRHRVELGCAREQAESQGVTEFRIVTIDLRQFGGSALTADLAVPKVSDAKPDPAAIPVTYVPARNTLFLSYALAWAEVLQAGSIAIGVNAVDYSGYPDCRPEFIQAYQAMASLATKRGVEGDPVEIVAPLLHLTKHEIIQAGLEIGVDYGLTSSCYDPAPNGAPCQECDSCVLRGRGFEAHGMVDPRVERFLTVQP